MAYRQRRPCSARSSRTGEPCRGYAMHGATVCRAHGASAGQVRRAAARRIAQEQAARMLAEVEVTPIDDPLLELERLAARALALERFFADRVASIEAAESERAGKVRQQAEAIYGKTVALLQQAEQASDREGAIKAIGQALVALRQLDGPALVGGHAMRAELDLYLGAMDRAQRFVRDLGSLGLDERRVRLAERQGELVADVLMGAMAAVFALVREALEAGGLDRDRLLAIEREEWPAIARRELLAAVPDRREEEER